MIDFNNPMPFVTFTDFDLDLMGVFCTELKDDDGPECPFKPGCGKTLRDCPRRAQAVLVRAHLVCGSYRAQ